MLYFLAELFYFIRYSGSINICSQDVVRPLGNDRYGLLICCIIASLIVDLQFISVCKL